MNDLYRGYEVKPVAGGFVWTDECGLVRYPDMIAKAPYATSDKAMDGIDQHKRTAKAHAA